MAVSSKKMFARADRRLNSWRPRVEVLEDRRLLATFTVGNSGDAGDDNPGNGACHTSGNVCTLRAAIEEANALSGTDTITFSISGTIQLTTALPTISTLMTIAKGSGPITVQGEGSTDQYRIFYINDGTSTEIPVTINGLIIRNGVAGTSVAVNGKIQGGGIWNSEDLTITNSRISSNELRGTTEVFEGGGIYNSEDGILTMSESTVTQNTVCPLETCTWSGTTQFNAAGGGIYNQGTLELSYSTISDNTVNIEDANSNTYGYKARGGGIVSDDPASSLTIHNSTIVNNEVNMVSGNDEEQRYCAGGGIWGGGETEIINSTITGNSSNLNIDLDQGDVRNITGGGGGATFHTTADVFVGWSTIAENTTTVLASGATDWSGGGGIYQDIQTGQPSIVLRNTIVADNTETRYLATSWEDIDACEKDDNSPLNCLDDGDGGVDDDRSSLYWSSGSVSDCNDCTDAHFGNPLLDDLDDYGGKTDTMALLSNSPAIDAGKLYDDAPPYVDPEFDQRGEGFYRVVNGDVDIGAFEVQAAEGPVAPSQDFAVLVTADDHPLFGKVKRRR